MSRLHHVQSVGVALRFAAETKRDVLRVGAPKRKRTVSFVQNVRGSKAGCIKLNLREQHEDKDLYQEFLTQLRWIAQGLINSTWINLDAKLRDRARDELKQIGYEPPEEYKAAWDAHQELYYVEFDVGDRTGHYKTGRGGWCVRIVDREYSKMCEELSTALKEYEMIDRDEDRLGRVTARRRQERDALYAEWGDPANWVTRAYLMPRSAPVLSSEKWLLGVNTDSEKDEIENLRETYPEPLVDIKVVVVGDT